ncbi:MAG: hypothetical protein ACYCVV_20885 [Acidimicrobiales bacterium]
MPTISRPMLMVLALALLLPALPAGAAGSARGAEDYAFHRGGNEHRRLERSRRHKHHVSCRSHTRVVFADGKAEIYLVYVHRRYEEGWVYRGCVFGGTRSYYVPGARAGHEEISWTGGSGTSHLTLSGEFVAYEHFSWSGSGGVPGGGLHEWWVVVRDLRTGRVLQKVPTGTPLEPEPTYIGVGPVVTLMLDSRGTTAAWIADDYERTPGVPGETSYKPFYDVEAVDKEGSRLLAAGTDIEPRSLALTGSTLYWTQGGVPHTATLE